MAGEESADGVTLSPDVLEAVDEAAFSARLDDIGVELGDPEFAAALEAAGVDWDGLKNVMTDPRNSGLVLVLGGAVAFSGWWGARPASADHPVLYPDPNNPNFCMIFTHDEENPEEGSYTPYSNCPAGPNPDHTPPTTQPTPTTTQPTPTTTQPTPTSTSAPAPTSTAAPAPTSTAAPEPTPTEAPSPTSTSTPTPTPTPSSTPTPSPTEAPTATPTSEPTPAPTEAPVSSSTTEAPESDDEIEIDNTDQEEETAEEVGVPVPVEQDGDGEGISIGTVGIVGGVVLAAASGFAAWRLRRGSTGGQQWVPNPEDTPPPSAATS